jgi:lipopolysaccharide heptosyltransferase II
LSLFFAPSRALAAYRREHGGGPRIYDPRERLLVSAADPFVRAASLVLGLRPRTKLEPRKAESVLALRLDRLGDLLTTLPALEVLRRALPDARIELAVGSWNEPVARRLPFVDGVRIVDTPWAAWGEKARLGKALRALGAPVDLAIDFQGDVRVVLLAALARAQLRAGYGDTGGKYLLTHAARWDETKSWYWQNLELVRTLFPDAGASDADPSALVRPYNFVTDEDRREAAQLLNESSLAGARRPLIGIQPSAGRALKEWGDEKFRALIERLRGRGTVVLTGSGSDRPRLERIENGVRSSDVRVLAGVPLATFAAVLERLDLFVTGDTGPMHLSHAVGTPNVAIFGPSDPARYGPDDALELRRVVRHQLYCSPCNMIRRPPRECDRAEAPDCLAGIEVDEVLREIEASLSAAKLR